MRVLETKTPLNSLYMVDGDNNLIKRAIKGDSAAFGALYDKYQTRIYRFIYIKVSHKEEAEDLTHQTFLNAWNRINEYNFRGFPFSSWLYRIARNQVIDFYRTRKTRIEIEGIEEIIIADAPDEDIDISLGVEQIKKAVQKLNSSEQDVIILSFVEELSSQEIAEALGKTPLAIRLIKHRAIKNLKKILKI